MGHKVTKACEQYASQVHTSGPNTESFLAFGDLDYSKFLNSFLTFLKIEQQAKENMVL